MNRRVLTARTLVAAVLGAVALASCGGTRQAPAASERPPVVGEETAPEPAPRVQ